MKIAAFDMRLTVADTPHFVEGGVLHLFSGEEEVAELNLVPVIEGKAMGISSWENKGREVVGHLRAGGCVHLARHGDYLAYWVEGNYNTLKSAGYFSGSRLRSRQYHGFVADRTDRDFDMSEENDIVASTTGAAGMAGPSPRDVAFRSGEKWWGICIPGALPVGETHMRVRPGRFSIDLCHYVASNTHGNLPEAFIVTDLDSPYDILDADVAICRERKELGKKQYQKWWSRPIFCAWCDETRDATIEGASLTADNVCRWAGLLRSKTGVEDFTIIIDAPWFDKYGDFPASLERFGGTAGMRELIDELHGAGHHVLVWFTPFKIDFDSDAALTQTDCLLLDENATPVRTGEASGCRDYTSAAARNTLINNLRYILSADEGCLNADGLKIELSCHNPDLGKSRLKNPRWGAGDEHWAGLLRHIHEDAHRFKDGCMITAAGLMSYLGNHTDMMPLDGVADETNAASRLRRARLGLRVMPNTLIGSGGRGMPRSKCPAYWMTSPVFSVPTVYRAAVLDGGKKIGAGDYRRLAAAWQVYANAPLDPDMEIVVEPETNTLYRKYTKGPMKGRLSAMGFGGKCFATFSPGRALVTASREIKISLPVPKKPRKLEAVYHDESRKRIKVVAANKEVQLSVPDAASDVKYLELTF